MKSEHRERIIAMSIILFANQQMHYHLSASIKEYLTYVPIFQSTGHNLGIGIYFSNRYLHVECGACERELRLTWKLKTVILI